LQPKKKKSAVISSTKLKNPSK